jgi:hypothetical protein
MTIVTSYDFESDTWTHHHGETPARQAFRAAVAAIAAKAKETLPECNGRVDKAVALVLGGDVELLDGGKAKVASQSNGTTQYFVVNGTCECRDFPKAPSGWCKHRIAAGLAKRVAARVRAPLDAPATGTPEGERPVAAVTPGPSQSASAPCGLPEAPASINVHLELAGRQVQLTLRDSDEGRLLQRLEAVLERFPVTAKPVDTTPQCPTHGPMKPSTKGKGWYCPAKLPDGRWCNSR